MSATASGSLNTMIGLKPAPAGASSSLIDRVTQAMQRPVAELSLAELRVLLSQGIAPDILVPRAIDALRENPLVCSDYYDGDLFSAVLKLPREFWASHQELWLEVGGLLSELDSAIEIVAKDRQIFEQATQPTRD
ncbi:MAG: contact-dependent growth inhibition system immunity protein [Devosia sp.]